MKHFAVVVAAAFIAMPAAAQPLSPTEAADVDKLVAKTLADTGVPSVEIAVVRNGQLVLNKAYGKANEGLPATADLPYQIASNSKQFTAMAILLLRDEGKLSLDDPVSKYVPDITQSDKITIRQLLSHTSGLQDYWPQDYMFSDMKVATTPQHILDKWAKKPLDFEPGTRWQYSNTGYVVAGLIAEKVSGQPLLDFLKQRVFGPLNMTSVIDQEKAVGANFPAGYHRSALGPVRVATPSAPGWFFAMGELSMNASDLAKWDIARMNRALLPARDWLEQETPVLRADGRTNGYGLGVYSRFTRQRHIVDHGGEAVGFLTQNSVYPDTKDAIVVFTNADFSGASDSLTAGLENILLNSADTKLTGEGDRLSDVKAIYGGLAKGAVDRAKLTDHLSEYFDATVLGDYRKSLSTLGAPKSIESLGPPRLRGGFVNRNFAIHYPKRTLTLVTYAEPGGTGRFEQFLVMPE